MSGMNRNLASAFALLISLGFPAMGVAADFAPSKTYAVGTSPSAVIAVDFNGDGKPDLVVANSSSSNVSILLGNGDGTFQAAKGVDVGGADPTSIAVADLNRDGKLDLVVAIPGNIPAPATTFPTCTQSSVNLLLGNGDGTFQAARRAVTVDSADLSVIAGDLNGDGRTDLVVLRTQIDSACPAPGGSVFLGNGDGSFQAEKSIAASAPVLVGDFNGDGKPDLLESESILLGNGDGTFQPPLGLPSLPSCGRFCRELSRHLVTGDFNDDGKLDIALARGSKSCIDICSAFPVSFETFVMLGNGDGTFRTATSVGSGGSLFLSGDFNGDGKVDLIAAPSVFNGSSLFYLLLGKGDGTFPTQFTFDIGSGPGYLLSADLNGDKLPDIVATDYTEAAVSVMLNTSSISGADLSVQISATPEPVSVTQNLTYTIQAVNSGPQDATNMVLKNTLPASVNFVSATSNKGSCAQANLVVTCNISKLVSGDNLAATLVVIPTAKGSVDDTASASATETDSLLGNNSASHTTHVDPMFSLKVTKSGAGSGTVTSNTVSGDINPINCGSTCAASEPTGTEVSLQAMPGAGSVFGGWGGACGPPPNTTPGCDLTMNQDQAATATFDVGPNFILAADASSLTLKRGSSIVSNLTILPEGTSFDNAITVSCSIAGPAPIPSCTPSPASVTPGANVANSVLTISSLGVSASLVPVGNESAKGTVYAAWLPLPTMFLVGLGLATRSKPRKAGRQLWLLFGLLLGFCALQAGCGVVASTPPPQQSYAVTVTAASGTISRSVQITLTVQ
jgi:uncharacterized repeat protein (TIGR01451 family)